MSNQQSVDINTQKIYTIDIILRVRENKMIYMVQVRKKYVSRIVGILAGLIIFTTISHRLNEMYVFVGEAGVGIEWYQIQWHHFYEDEGKIDNIYLGSSHVYCDIDPTILDQLNGQYNFDLAMPNQTLAGSYYLLREADRTNELRHVYLEMYYKPNIDDSTLSDKRNWNNIDYMKPSLNKAEYILATAKAEQYINIFLPFSRYRKHLGEWECIKDNLEKKGQKSYQNYQFESCFEDGNGKNIYEKQGYRRCTRVYHDYDKIYNQRTILSEYSMGEKTEGYCRKIIEYCQEREIPITLFISPIYDLQLISTIDYDEYINNIKALADEYDIPFYDFNLVKEEWLTIQDGKYFSDVEHLNQWGSKLFTPFFHQVISGTVEDSKMYFYASYQEKLRALPPAIYGVYYRRPKEQEEMTSMWVASNRDSGMEYRIILTPEEGEPYVLLDFDENTEFLVPRGERGICTLSARMTGAMEELQVMEIHYDTNY